MQNPTGVRRVRLLVLAPIVSTFMVVAALSTPALGSSPSTGTMRSVAKGAGERTLVARLRGSREVPGPGDPNGKGHVRITLHPAMRMVCARAHWRNLGKPVAAHIHRGRAGVSGAVVVDLTGSVTSGPNCVKAVPRPLIRRIADHPRRFYYNIHTRKYPAGAIRGQLHHRRL
jgi:CHRD domain